MIFGRSLKLLSNLPRFGKTTKKQSANKNLPSTITPQESAIPEWILIAGGIFGSVIAMVAIQRIFPRKLDVIHKDEVGRELGRTKGG